MPATKTAPPAKTAGSSQSPLLSLWKAYYETTSTRLKTIDAFLVFLMLSGIIQFLYCILISNFPFNAFLAGYVTRLAALGSRTQVNYVASRAASDSSCLQHPFARR